MATRRPGAADAQRQPAAGDGHSDEADVADEVDERKEQTGEELRFPSARTLASILDPKILGSMTNQVVSDLLARSRTRSHVTFHYALLMRIAIELVVLYVFAA